MGNFLSDIMEVSIKLYACFLQTPMCNFQRNEHEQELLVQESYTEI